MSKQQDLQQNKSDLWKLRHTAEHVLHQAVKEMYPSIHLAMGPATEDGFYFDFDSSPDGREAVKISEEDFPEIEKRMQKIINKNLPVTMQTMSVDEARKLFADNPYKLEWVDLIESKGEDVTVFWTGEPGAEGSMVDLCAGPHVESTGKIKAFKLLSVAGAYWHGDEKNKMLTRIYGTAFESKEELKEYLHRQEEARKRDHRKLGKELDLFVFSELVGSGLPLYTAKGALIRRLLQQYVGELQQSIGYEEAWTPQLTRAELFKVSGHYDKYKDDMFQVRSNYSEEEFFLKPMNCPMHAQIYASKPRSYRDLPIRIADYANLYRDEKPGELSGLSRLRAFSQDDGHCFCREDQIEAEFTNVANIIKVAIETFGMKYWIRLSLWDPENKEKYLGSPETWERSQSTLEKIVNKLGVEYQRVEGEAAIYGPKMDFMAIDALGREWQISTIQLDFIQPERFELKYTDQNGESQMPVMIHRAILGSPERFMGLLIEHFAGAFPTWLSPVQVAIVSISEDQLDYAKEIQSQLQKDHIRVEIYGEAESMQNRIRKAAKEKIPYILVAGKREVEEGTVAVRRRGTQSQDVMKVEEFVDLVKKDVMEKMIW